MKVPAGFSGWWCARCEQACPSIPADLDAAQARCPHCHKWTAVWVPPALPAVDLPPSPPRDHRPRAARSQALFAHLRAVIENPTLNPDLNEIEREEYTR